MTKTGKKSNINLLPQEGFSTSIGGRILLWSLSTFRTIVIITEIVVMLAFLSRFFLDAKNTDLNKEIEEKKDLIAASSEFENEFRDIQERLRLLSELNARLRAVKNLDLVRTSLPPDVFLESLLYGNHNLQLSGFSPNERGIQQLIINLDANEKVKNVILASATSDSENETLVHFRIQVNLKVNQT